MMKYGIFFFKWLLFPSKSVITCTNFIENQLEFLGIVNSKGTFLTYLDFFTFFFFFCLLVVVFHLVNRKNMPLKFDRFRKENCFIDCFLVSGDQKFPAHKIILSNKSRYFHEYFQKSNVNNDGVLEIDLPINPGNFFINVINFIYTHNINITIDNVSYAYKCAEFYKIDFLFNVVLEKLKEFLTWKNILTICKSFIQNDITSCNELLATSLFSYIQKGKFKSWKNIMHSISPAILAYILKELPDYTEDEKVQVIDNYYEKCAHNSDYI